MKHIDVDQQDKKVRDFLRALSESAEGAILEVGGKPVLKVVPVVGPPIDAARIRAAIRKRRDESRKLNAEWEAADQEVWDKLPPSEG